MNFFVSRPSGLLSYLWTLLSSTLNKPSPESQVMDIDLSDDQVQQLLKDAEQRMNTAAQDSQSLINTENQVQKSISTVSTRYAWHHHFRIQRIRSSLILSHSLSTGTSIAATSYIKNTANGALVDPSRLVKPLERRLANDIRRVENPVTIKTNATKVRRFYPTPHSHTSMRKIYPNFTRAEF